MNTVFFSIDSDRIYSASNDFFAAIEYATDIKLKGKKPARLYHENKGYLGQNEQWVKDKDQAILFETKRELNNWLKGYFTPDDSNQGTFFEQFTVTSESNSDNKPSEIKHINQVKGDSCLISEKDYYERVLKEFRSSGISDEVTFCSVKIYPPSKGQELAKLFIPSLLNKEGKLHPDFENFKSFFGGGWVANNNTKDGKVNPLTCVKLFNPRIKPDNPSESIKYEYPLGKKPSNCEYYLLPHFGDRNVLKSLIQGIIDKHKLDLKADDFKSYADFFNAAKKLIKVNVSEGNKKAVRLICDGELAFSLTSIYTWGYKDNDGNTITDQDGFRKLSPKLNELLHGCKGLIVNFDSDKKKTTMKNVNQQVNELAIACHKELGISCQRRLWDTKLGKGIDDLLANNYTLENNTQIITIDADQLIADVKPQKVTKKEKTKTKVKIKSGNTSDMIVTYKDEVIRDLFDGYWITINDNWYQFNGKYYEEVDKAKIKQRILNYLDNYIIQDENGNPKKPYASNSCVNETYNWIRVKFCKLPKEVNIGGLPLNNGILTVTENLDLPNKIEVKLLPHTPDKYFTYCSEVDYNPKADLTEGYKLLECLNEPYKTLLIQSLSTILNFSLIRKKRDRIKALILEGDGNNGKDTLRNVITLILGGMGITGCNFNDFRLADTGRAFNLKRLETNPKINWSSENKSNMSLDDLQSLKQVITGDPIYIEGKGIDGYDITLNALFIFNANKVPHLKANQAAIQSRFTIIPFEKVYSMSPTQGQLKANPRYKHDPEFLIKEVCPAMLNLLVTAFEKVYHHGIDYDSASEYINKVMLDGNHLRQFCLDTGLKFTGNNDDFIYCSEIFQELEYWYIETGRLDKDGKKSIWLDNGDKNDPVIKAANQVKPRFKQLFPKIKEVIYQRKIRLTGLAWEKTETIASLRTNLPPDSPLTHPNSRNDLPVSITATSIDSPIDSQLTHNWVQTDSHFTQGSTKDNEIDTGKKDHSQEMGTPKSESKVSQFTPKSESKVSQFVSQTKSLDSISDKDSGNFGESVVSQTDITPIFSQDQETDKIIYSDDQGKIYRENATLYAWVSNSSKLVMALSDQDFIEYIQKYPDATLDHFMDHFYIGSENDTEAKKTISWYFEAYKKMYRADDLPSKDDLVNILREHTKEGNHSEPINRIDNVIKGLESKGIDLGKYDHAFNLIMGITSELTAGDLDMIYIFTRKVPHMIKMAIFEALPREKSLLWKKAVNILWT